MDGPLRAMDFGGNDLTHRSVPGIFALMSFRSPTSAVLALFVLFGTAIGSAQAKTLECEELPALFRSYSIHHYAIRKLDDETRSRTAKLFVEAIDPSRTLLLQEDVDGLKKALPQVFSGAFRGRCGAIERAMNLTVTRSEADLRLARQVLDDDYALDESVELVLDPEARGWPKTEAERKALVEKQIHFQMASYLAGGLELKKAKDQLVHRYELNLKRARERKERGRGTELFASAFALALDPHSSYLSQDDLEDFRIQMQLSLEGIGAALRSEDGFTYIESLIPGGAAERSEKLQPKDKIIAVQSEGEKTVSTIDMSIRDVVKLIRGPKGTKVTLTILREGKNTRTFDVTIVRDKIDVKQQAAKIEYETRKLGDRSVKIGVLELPSFYGGNDEGRSSYQDVKRLVAEAKKAGVDGMVLDLSKNGGGLLEDAVRISGLFLKTGGIVATRGTRGEFEVLEDEDPDVQYGGPLAVMISPVSASGAEILAGALQAYGRAVVVGGPRTFGKGTVQAVLPLPSQLGAMKITTGMFFLPDGQSTQLQGVTADVRVPSLLDSFDVGEQDLDFALPPGKVDPFLSDEARGTGKSAWPRFDPNLASRLQKRSTRRVARSDAFEKMKERIAEAKSMAKDEPVKLSELDDEDGAEGAEDENGKEDLEQIEEAYTDEAVNILVDWMRLRGVKTAAR